MDENVTVISGIFRVGLGEKFDKDALRDLPAGSYAMLPIDFWVGEWGGYLRLSVSHRLRTPGLIAF